MPRATSSCASLPGVVAIPGQSEEARARLQMRDDRLERAAMQRKRRAILQAPAEPRGGEREGRRRGQADHFLGGDMAHQQAPMP